MIRLAHRIGAEIRNGAMYRGLIFFRRTLKPIVARELSTPFAYERYNEMAAIIEYEHAPWIPTKCFVSATIRARTGVRDQCPRSYDFPWAKASFSASASAKERVVMVVAAKLNIRPIASSYNAARL
jgi:hypothetical protein